MGRHWKALGESGRHWETDWETFIKRQGGTLDPIYKMRRWTEHAYDYPGYVNKLNHVPREQKLHM